MPSKTDRAVQLLENGWTINRVCRETGLSRGWVKELADGLVDLRKVINASKGKATTLTARRCPRCGAKIFERLCRGCRDQEAVRRQRQRRNDEPAEIVIEILEPEYQQRYRELLGRRLDLVESRQAESAEGERYLRHVFGLITEDDS